jgi:hypothetical protein
MQQFMSLTREDLPFFSTLEAAQSIVRRSAVFVLLIPLFPVVVLFAQVVPFIFRRHLNVILPALPFIQSREDLTNLKTAFTLYFWALKGYRPFCLLRRQVDILLEDLDDEIDSIDLVIERGEELRGMVSEIQSRT